LKNNSWRTNKHSIVKTNINSGICECCRSRVSSVELHIPVDHCAGPCSDGIGRWGI